MGTPYPYPYPSRPLPVHVMGSLWSVDKPGPGLSARVICSPGRAPACRDSTLATNPPLHPNCTKVILWDFRGIRVLLTAQARQCCLRASLLRPRSRLSEGQRC